MRMGMGIRGGDGEEEHEEVSRDGEGEVGVMASLESWRVGDLWSGKVVLWSQAKSKWRFWFVLGCVYDDESAWLVCQTC